MPKERSLKDLKQILKNKYKENDKIERLFYPDNPLPLAECYLDLVLVEEKPLKAKKAASFGGELMASSSIQEDLSSREYFLHEYERIEYIQKKLDIKAILAECKQAKKRIYIEGAAGAGKSTLSRYLANEWANDKEPWNQYEWVFYIRLRELSIENYSAQLEELLMIVSGELFQGHGNHLERNELDNLIHALASQPQKVLWILDGYDELNSALANCNWWKDLLYSHYDILITSRPGVQKKDLEINLNLAVLGFSDKQVEKYIRNFFNVEYTPYAQTADAKQCLALIKRNPNFWSLAHIPIQLELMCSIWEDLEKKQELPITELYRVMLDRLLKRCAQKEDLKLEELSSKQLKSRYANYLTYMEYLAFLGVQTKKIILPEKYINAAYNSLPVDKHQQMDFYKQLKALGIVKRYNNGKQAEFEHLTFQEYFAARYVSKLIKAFSQGESYGLSHQVLSNFINRTKWDNFYEVMWRFVAGLLGGKPNEAYHVLEHYRFQNGDSNVNSINTSEKLTLPKSHQRLQTLQTYFDLLLQEPREQLEAFELPLLVDCLAEAGMPNIMQKEAIKLHFQKWLEFYWLKGKEELERSLLQKLVYVLRSSRELVSWVKPILLELLKDKNPQVRRVATKTVGNLGASINDELQKVLLPLLKDNVDEVRALAAFAVGNLGASANYELQKGLLVLLRDKDSQVRYLAAKAVGNLDAPVNEELPKILLPLLKDKDPYTRHAAAEVVGNLGASANVELQKGLLLLFQDEASQVRHAAAAAVGSLGSSANDELQQGLLPLLQDEASQVRCVAAEAVGSLSASANNELQQGLLSLLQAEKPLGRRAAAKAVGYLGASANDELQKGLLPLLNDENSDMRCVVAFAVGNLGASVNEELQKGLLVLFQAEDSQVRLAAARAVGKLGASANDELQKGLLALLQDEDSDVRWVVAEVAGNLGASAIEELQEVLLPLLKYEDRDVRVTAAFAVGNLGASANDKLQKGLLALLQDKDGDVRHSAVFAVGNLGVSAKDELQKGLLELICDKNSQVRCVAAKAVGKLGASTTDELQKGLLELFRDKDSQVRLEAVAAVGNLGTSAIEELQEGLLPLLKDEDGDVLVAATQAVGKLGTSSIEALQKGLLVLLEDEPAWVCSIVKRALACTKSGLVMVCQKIFKDYPLSIPPSHIILSSRDVVKVDEHGKLDCLKLCGTVIQNLFQSNGSHNLTDTQWTLAIVRRKTYETAASLSRCPNPFGYFYKSMQTLASHAFLILEGIKDGVRFATKIDLYAVGGSGSQSSGQKVAIQITQIDNFSRLEELAANSCSMVHGISRERAKQLLENIEQDKASAEQGGIVYSLTGDGSLSAANTQQKHSCISWCLEKWQQAGLPLERKWHDTIVIIPTAYLEEAKKSEVKCLVM